MLALLRTKLKLAELSGFGGKQDIVSSLGPYLQGWADAFTRTAPDLIDELAEEIEKVMCDSQTSDTQLMVMSHVLMMVPELGNPAGYECVFKRRPAAEVLTDTVAAWRVSSLPRTPAMEQLAETTVDENLKRALTQDEADAPEPRSFDGVAPAPDPAARPETSPLLEKDVEMALRHAQRTGNTEHQKSLTETLARLRAEEP
jgi:hypothetical protein